MKKAIFKSIIFLLILFVFIWGIGKVLQPKRVDIQPDTTAKVIGFYNEPKNSLDVVFCGTSKMFCLINPNELWKEYGFTSYDFATNEQPVWITYYYIKEVFKYQNPKVIVLDAYFANYGNDDPREPVLRASLDFLKMSPDKINAVFENAKFDDIPSYFLPFFRYHDRWPSLTENDFKYAFYNEKHPFHGFSPMYMVKPAERPEVEGINETQPIGERAEAALKKITELCKQNGAQLLLLNTPYCVTEKEQKKFNYLAGLAEEMGIPFLDCDSKYDEIGLDFSKDYIDLVHTNVVGSEKVTKYVGKYLKDNYELPDNRSNPDFREWNETLKKWQEYNKEHLPTLGTPEADQSLEGDLI